AAAQRLHHTDGALDPGHSGVTRIVARGKSGDVQTPGENDAVQLPGRDTRQDAARVRFIRVRRHDDDAARAPRLEQVCESDANTARIGEHRPRAGGTY